MTSAEMKLQFLVEYDRVASLSAPGYDDFEISSFLTNAQKVYIDKKYDSLINKTGDGIDGSEKRRRELSELLSDAIDGGGGLQTSVSSNQNGVHVNGVFFDIPDDVLYIIEEYVI